MSFSTINHLHRPKRQRSSSPVEPIPGSLASPLEDVLMKRQRRDGYFGIGEGSQGDHRLAESGDADMEAEEVISPNGWPASQIGYTQNAEAGPSITAGVERRRRKLWEGRNGPSIDSSQGRSSDDHIMAGKSSQSSSGHSHANDNSAPQLRSSQTGPAPSTTRISHLNGGAIHSSPSPSPIYDYDQSQHHFHNSLDSNGHAHRQPHPMSSSPIRHEPPGSSPFRAGPSTQSQNGSQRTYVDPDETLRADGQGSSAIAGNDEAEMEELQRAWGEYRGANAVLYNLHRARMSAQSSPAHYTNPFPTRTNHLRTHAHTPHTDNPHFMSTHDANTYTDITTPLNEPNDPYDHTADTTHPSSHANQVNGSQPMITPNRNQGLPTSASAYITPFPSRTSNNLHSRSNHHPASHSTNPSPLPPRLNSLGASRGMLPPSQHTSGTAFQHYRTPGTAQYSFNSSPFSSAPASSTRFHPESSPVHFDNPSPSSSQLNGRIQRGVRVHVSRGSAAAPSTRGGNGYGHGHGASASAGEGDGMEVMLDEEDDQSFELDEDLDMEREEVEAMRRYEEMNRALGEFEVARRERRGG